MKKNNSARRNFIKLSSMGFGGFAITSIAGTGKETASLANVVNTSDTKLHIVCMGAHPGCNPNTSCV